ncbi:MAG: hypothetical protein PHT80_15805, partial [Lentisphaeria bacterium]|nr:hypothetical protein [Lentisphaeria bacterium]
MTCYVSSWILHTLDIATNYAGGKGIALIYHRHTFYRVVISLLIFAKGNKQKTDARAVNVVAKKLLLWKNMLNFVNESTARSDQTKAPG